MDSKSPILQRTFEREDGPVPVEIFLPRPDPKPEIDGDPDNPSWKCQYRIEFADGRRVERAAYGVDGMQAMLLALTAVKHELQMSDPPVTWLEDDQLGIYISTYE